ncbi:MULTISPECIES: long-chain-fatty-acid--CoA ligase [Dermacoccus]|uniref:Long-chain fatty acid--CoA ligase n=2 Tax=Dermacoccus TaxID=57495 RepID=A0A417Z457_9MICO|nr:MULTISPECIES: long-chain fatty acid--CoA ligase [Dermacoccus]QNK53207.1 long-chain fatty acid--CoA ligase [Dermacoccus sp. PAMC28757]RHW45247.1 long-chain fatty acid--CoA ligase [Dermacoccus abyssi]
MTNLADNLVRTAQKLPDGAAIKLDDFTLTWHQLDDATQRVVTFLRDHGIEPGDRVALSLANVPAFPVIAYGVWRSGAVLVPMNPLFMAREVEYYLEDAGVKLVFGMGGESAKGAANKNVEYVEVGADQLQGVLGALEPTPDVVDRADDDTAVILYTSGTTGRPKGAELTHRSLDINQEVSARTLMAITSDDVIMGCLPLFHVFGLTCGLNTSVATGATLTLIPRFDPNKALDVVGRDKVTIFQGVPTMYQAMLAAAANRDDYDMSSLRTCASGGSAMPVEVLKKFEQRFEATILEGYGLSETSPVASFNHPNAERKPGSIGTPIEGVEMIVADSDGKPVAQGEVGEIAIRGHLLMKGYWNRPDATAEAIRDGWFFSGDLAHQDEDGYFFIVDRAKDMIIRGGYNVYPREVEEALYENEEIAEVAVVGVPDEHYGEEIAAFVVRTPGSSLSEDDVKEFAKARVAAYKYPRTVTFIDALPKGATGKILKRELRS